MRLQLIATLALIASSLHVHGSNESHAILVPHASIILSDEKALAPLLHADDPSEEGARRIRKLCLALLSADHHVVAGSTTVLAYRRKTRPERGASDGGATTALTIQFDGLPIDVPVQLASVDAALVTSFGEFPDGCMGFRATKVDGVFTIRELPGKQFELDLQLKTTAPHLQPSNFGALPLIFVDKLRIEKASVSTVEAWNAGLKGAVRSGD